MDTIMKKIISFALAIIFSIGQLQLSFAYENLSPAWVSNDMGTGRSVAQTDVARKTMSGAIGNGASLVKLLSSLPDRIPGSEKECPDGDKAELILSVREKVSEALQLAINKHLEKRNLIDAKYNEQAEKTFTNLLNLQQYLLHNLYLFNAVVEGKEDYLVGFRRENETDAFTGLTPQLIEYLHEISILRLAQYIYHENIPEKGIELDEGIGKEDGRDEHRTVISKLRVPVFGREEVKALKKNIRDFINLPTTSQSLTIPDELLGKPLTTGDKTGDGKEMEAYREIKQMLLKMITVVRKTVSQKEGYDEKNIINGKLDQIQKEVENFEKAAIGLLPENYPDASYWNEKMKKYRNWRDNIPLDLAYHFFQHRLMSVIGYWKNKIDFFACNKDPGVDKAYNDFLHMRTKQEIDVSSEIAEKEILKTLFINSIVGNQADLGNPKIFKSLLVNEIEKTIKFLNELFVNKRVARLDWFTDNVGQELLNDLNLINFLFRYAEGQKCELKIIIHVKETPSYFSDVTEKDLCSTFERLAESDNDKQCSLGRYLKTLLTSGSLSYVSAGWLSKGDSRVEIPEKDKKDLVQSDLLILKGEYLYRRFVGAYYHHYESKLDDIMKDLGLPPILTLKVMKSEVGTDIPESKVLELEAYDPDWYKKGFGVVQLTEDHRPQNASPMLMREIFVDCSTSKHIEITYNAELFKHNILQLLQKYPNIKFAIAIDTDIGGIEQAGDIAALWKVIDQLENMTDEKGDELFPNLHCVRGSASEGTLMRRIKENLTENPNVVFNTNNLFLVGSQINIDTNIFDSLKGTAWITGIDDSRAGKESILPVFESITLSLMAALNVDLERIKSFYDSIANEPITIELLRDMKQNRLFKILPKMTRQTQNLRELYERVRDIYLAV